MKPEDYQYICENIANISRIPIRLYQNKDFVFGDLGQGFSIDPASLYLEELLSNPLPISYYITRFYQFYGIINHGNYTIIIGPCYQLPPARAQIREFMFLLDIKNNYMEEYETMLRSITPMPMDMFLHFLCLLNFYMRGEKLAMSELPIWDAAGNQEHSLQISNELLANQELPQSDYLHAGVHDTLEFEHRMLSYVTAGEVAQLEQLFQSTSAGQSGKMADTYLRQVKDLFITTATLVSRAAIAGGIPVEEALQLSDSYVQHCEKHDNAEQILNLQHHMVMDYATMVSNRRLGDSQTTFLRDITSYIASHIHDNIRVEEIAAALYLSRSYLSTRFKRETGQTLSHYIQQQKIEKAQEYLRSSTKSIAEISEHLGFSSQAYFQNVFRKSCGVTPKYYREHTLT